MHDQLKPYAKLLIVLQRNDELLKDFVDQFNKEKFKVYDLNEIVAITAFCSRVQNIKCAT